jgi:hypothetical protein
MLYSIVVREVRYLRYEVDAHSEDEAASKYYDGKCALENVELANREIDSVEIVDPDCD